MRVKSKNSHWLKVVLQKSHDWGKGVVIYLPDNKKITVHLSTRETACVQYDKVDDKGNVIENIDSFVVNDKMEWYDPNA